MNTKQKFSAEEIARRVAELGSEIRRDAGEGEILLIGLLKGAAIFTADLLRAIPGRVRYEFIDVVRDTADTTTAEALEIDFLTHFDMKGRNIYLVKDVVATGVIETYLLSQLRTHQPTMLKLVALLDRIDQRTMDLDVDYRAFAASEGIFVGYGLEYDGQYSNLPFIASL